MQGEGGKTEEEGGKKRGRGDGGKREGSREEEGGKINDN